MRMKSFRAVILGLGLFLSVPAPAEEPRCTTVSDGNLPPAFSAWGQPASAVAAGATAADATRIEPEVAAEIRLLSAITPALAPGRSRPVDNAHAGLLVVKIPGAGKWRVGLSGPAWIDVIGTDGKPVASAGHGHMAPCTTLKKVVEFDLPAGDHLIQISGNPGPTLKLLVSRGS
jgi:hypothetical protein